MITNFDYTEERDGPVFWWMERVNGKATIHKKRGISPRFYVPRGRGMAPSRFTNERGEHLDIVDMRFPRETYKIRGNYMDNGVQTYEADRLFHEVAAEDAGVKPSDLLGEPRRHCYIDIETDDTSGVHIRDLIKFPRAPILIIGVIDSFRDETHVFRVGDRGWGKDRVGEYEFRDHAYTTEQEMLSSFFRYCRFQLFDDYIGWNSSGGTDKFGKGAMRINSGFDIPYILARSREMGVSPASWSPCDVTRLTYQPDSDAYRSQIKLAQLLDLMYFSIYSQRLKIQHRSPPDYKLDTIGRLFLGKGKIEKAGSVARQYREEPRKAVLYNIRDVVMLKELEEKYRIIERYTGLLNYAVMHLDDAMYATRVLDRYSIRLAHAKGIVLPTKRRFRYEDGEFVSRKRTTGADVIEPVPGVYEGVATIDCKGMYPSLIRALNVGYETKDSSGKICAPNGICFQDSPRSLTASMYDEIEDLKRYYKSILANLTPGTPEYFQEHDGYMGVKAIVNASIGSLGAPSARFFDPDMFNAVTTGGTRCIHLMEKCASDRGYGIVTGDTDSILVQMPFDECDELVAEINTRLAEMLQSWGAVSSVEADLERYSERVLIGVKKRRAELVCWEDGKNVDYISIKGLEVIRRDSSPWMAECQREALNILLREGTRAVVKKIRQWNREMENVSHEDLCDWCPVKNVSSDSTCQNVKAINNSFRDFNFEVEPLETPKKMVTRRGVYAFRSNEEAARWKITPDFGYYRDSFKRRLNGLLKIAGGVWPFDRLVRLDSFGGEKKVFVDAKEAIKNKRKRRR